MNPRWKDEEQPPHPADCVDDAPVFELPRSAKAPRKKKPLPKLDPNRKGPPIYMLYSGKVAVQTARGWVEANFKAAKHIFIGAGIDERDARDYSAALPPAAGITFDPRTTEPVIETDGERWLNTFRGMPPVGPDGGPEKYEMVTLLLAHIVDGDEAGLEYLLDWIAAPLQSLYFGKGSKRNLSAIVLVGNEGTGKGMVSIIFEQLYGSEHIVRMDQSAIEDIFAPVAIESALFVVANEITSKTNRGDQHVMNRLKEWVTDEKIPIRRMHAASEKCRAHFNMLLTTNDVRHPIKISTGDRRYSVFDQQNKLSDGLRDAFIADRAAGFPQVQAFAAAMLKRTITHDLTKPYENEARAVVRDASKEPATAFAEWLSEVGIEVASEDWVLRAKGLRRSAGEDDIDEKTCPWTDTKRGRFVPARIMAAIFASYCSVFYPKTRSTDGLQAALAKVGIIGDQRQKFQGATNVGYMPVPKSIIDPEAKTKPKVSGYTAKWEPVKN